MGPSCEIQEGVRPQTGESAARELCLLQNDPRMPTLEIMKARLARNPRALGRLWLLMSDLTCKHLFGMDDLHMGRHVIHPRCLLAHREDNFCGSTDASLFCCPQGALAPMESQGRCFVPHAHMKIHAPAALGLRHLRHMLLAEPEAMEQALQDYMTALLEAATALQYAHP